MNVLITRTVPASTVLPGDHVWHQGGAYDVDEVSRNRDGQIAIAMFLAYVDNPRKVRSILRVAAEAEVQTLLDGPQIDKLAAVVADAVGPGYRTWVAELDMVVQADGTVLPIDLSDLDVVDRVLRAIEVEHPSAIGDHARLIERRNLERRALAEQAWRAGLDPVDDGLTSRPALSLAPVIGTILPEVTRADEAMAEGAAMPGIITDGVTCPESGEPVDECGLDHLHLTPKEGTDPFLEPIMADVAERVEHLPIDADSVEVVPAETAEAFARRARGLSGNSQADRNPANL